MMSSGGIEPVCVPHRHKDFRSGVFKQLYKTIGLEQFPFPQVAVTTREQGENQHTASFTYPLALFTQSGGPLFRICRP